VLKLHRIAPELIWAKDTTAKFFCWGKIVRERERDRKKNRCMPIHILIDI
jgi:hypothetical protein